MMSMTPFTFTCIRGCHLQVSHTFCRDFINLLLRDDGASGQFGGTDVLVQGLRRVSHLDAVNWLRRLFSCLLHNGS